MRRFSRSILFRALSVLALATLAVVVVAGTSPGATRFLTKAKAKNLFYTKPQSDNRFVNVGEGEGWHVVGMELGGVPFGPGHDDCFEGECWQNLGGNIQSTHNLVGFYKDPLGVVHLRGIPQCKADTACNAAGDVRGIMFTLPAGYRPPHQEAAAVLSSVAGNIARVDVTAGGEVWLRSPNIPPAGWVSLDGITFRAA
ncbi:MAG TPA: hypothetical protein VFY54_08825 [Rubrobacter sp.]|jgi:hypothetical protein|nr:hypothetical protein [Rubrobacter sp.]